MRLLYVASGHPLQEADDCLMWQKLGIDWFSTGYYSLTNKPGDLPYIEQDGNCQLLCQMINQHRWTYSSDKADTSCGKKNMLWTGQIPYNRWNFDQTFLSNFDAVLFNYFVENYVENVGCLGKCKPFLKTYSMHQLKDERDIRAGIQAGLRVIRNSPKEHMRGKYGGHSAIIRGSVVKDEHEISGWVGDVKRVCTFASFLYGNNGEEYDTRAKIYTSIVKKCGYPCDLLGIGSRFVSHEEKLQILRSHRVNLVTGTPNANNTYSMVEGWIMGQPLVVFGRQLWDSKSYEADELIKHGVTGFIGNTVDECAKYIKLLMEDDDLAQEVGRQGREAAIKVYGREVLAQQWKSLFEKEGLL
jgi:hypothetical protein